MGSVLLKESINSSIGDDDKIYFFFTERSQEQIAYPSQTKVSRVARVCKVREHTGQSLSENVNVNVINALPRKHYLLVGPQGDIKEEEKHQPSKSKNHRIISPVTPVTQGEMSCHSLLTVKSSLNKVAVGRL